MPRSRSSSSGSGSTGSTNSSAQLGFEATAPRNSALPKGKATSRSLSATKDNRWLAADKLRNNMDAGEYKHIVLGLIFLSRARQITRQRTRRASTGVRVKYISDSFEEHHGKLVAGKGDYEGANPEDPDEPSGDVLWVSSDFLFDLLTWE